MYSVKIRSIIMWLVVVQPLHSGSPICFAVLITSASMAPMLDQEDMALRNTAGASREIGLVMIRSVGVEVASETQALLRGFLLVDR